jgi:hypothetical protein
VHFSGCLKINKGYAVQHALAIGFLRLTQHIRLFRDGNLRARESLAQCHSATTLFKIMHGASGQT